jgi:hypothetical protein
MRSDRQVRHPSMLPQTVAERLLKVAVGFQPTVAEIERIPVAERRLNTAKIITREPSRHRFQASRRDAERPINRLSPWVQTHGYHHGVAPRLGMAVITI